MQIRPYFTRLGDASAGPKSLEWLELIVESTCFFTRQLTSGMLVDVSLL